MDADCLPPPRTASTTAGKTDEETKSKSDMPQELSQVTSPPLSKLIDKFLQVNKKLITT